MCRPLPTGRQQRLVAGTDAGHFVVLQSVMTARVTLKVGTRSSSPDRHLLGARRRTVRRIVSAPSRALRRRARFTRCLPLYTRVRELMTATPSEPTSCTACEANALGTLQTSSIDIAR